jgi:hypothetical protein
MFGRMGFCRGVWATPALWVCTAGVSAEVDAADALSAGVVLSDPVVLAVADAVVSAGMRSALPEQAQRTTSPPRSCAVKIEGFHTSM